MKNYWVMKTHFPGTHHEIKSCIKIWWNARDSTGELAPVHPAPTLNVS